MSHISTSAFHSPVYPPSLPGIPKFFLPACQTLSTHKQYLKVPYSNMERDFMLAQSREMSPSRPQTPERLPLEDVDPDVPPPPPPTPYTALPKPKIKLPDEGHFSVSSILQVRFDRRTAESCVIGIISITRKLNKSLCV